MNNPFASLASFFSRKSNPDFAQYMQYGTIPQPVTMTGNPRQYAKEGYRRNDTAHKCIDYISRNAAGIRIALYADATKKREITSDPILDLLAKPNISMSQQDYVESCIAYQLLYGNSYQLGMRAGKAGPFDELWVLDPVRVDIVPDGKQIVRYDYRITERPAALDPMDVGHSKYWCPDDDLYGLSPIEVAAIMIDQNVAARKYNLALLQNSGQPPGAWIVPAVMDKKSRDILEDKINKKYAGYKNAGKIPVLDGGMKFEPTGIPPAQMAYLELLTHNGASIANIYNLAPQVVGDTSASTYDNYEQAVYGSYTEAIFPNMDKLMGTLNRWLVPQFGKSSKVLGYDKQSVETIQKMMQAQEAAKADRWTKVYLAGGCLLSTYQEKIGIEPDKQGNVYRIKDLIIPAKELEAYAEQCMTAPAVPTLPIPEGTPPPTDPLAKPPVPVTIPPKDPKKNQGDAYEEIKLMVATMVRDALASQDIKAGSTRNTRSSASRVRVTEILRGNEDIHQSKVLINGVYQPDDLHNQLAKLQSQGVQYVTWKCYTPFCPICGDNKDVTVELGKPFPSGHILPPAHPNCECEVVQAAEKSILLQRDEYSVFMRKYA